MFIESHLNLTTEDEHFHVSCSISHKKEKLTIFSICLYEQNFKNISLPHKKTLLIIISNIKKINIFFMLKEVKAMRMLQMKEFRNFVYALFIAAPQKWKRGFVFL